MKIAILGWGSLIWYPKNLEFDKTLDWNPNGPILPFEFARISKDGRLTLVITEKGSASNSLYSISTNNNLADALKNLAKRENCPESRIGYYNRLENKFSQEDLFFKETLLSWIEDTDIDAVIWTNLLEKWETTNDLNENMTVLPEKRIEYLKNLNPTKTRRAEEYIRYAPAQIKTKYRTQIEEELGWHSLIFDREERIKLRLGDRKPLKFMNTSGSGNLICNYCGHSERVTSFIHGHNTELRKRCASIGHQCEDCGKFEALYNIEGSPTPPQNCSCGGKLLNEDPVFCPKCTSYNVRFNTIIMT